MIISRGRNYIFIHIPKTGGSSMATALEGRAMADDIHAGRYAESAQAAQTSSKEIKARGRLWKHSTLRDIEGLVSAQEIAEAFVFTMVRNPWDWVVSYYHWLQAQSFEHRAVAAAKGLEFSDFLREPSVANSLRAGHDATYVTGPDGTELCDLFVRLEHLNEDVPQLEKFLNIKLRPFPRENTSVRPASAEAYTASDRDYVGALCATDIARFGYRFPD